MKRTALNLVIGVLIGLTACGRNQSTQDNKIMEKKEETQAIIDAEGKVLSERIQTPEGYTRTEAKEESGS